jgi:dehydrogenase/reductase SDR family member 7B
MKNKVVIVTGGTSGIGRALAYEFGRYNNKIVITGRNEQKLEDTRQWLLQQNIDCFAVMSDVSNEQDNQRMVEATMDHYGRIDVLINNAGVSMRALFADLQLDVFRKVMDINFMGTVYATKYCLPQIIQNKGSIVGISSIVGYRGTPARSAYSASKYAMQGFLEVLRTEVMKRGVHVLVACPGFTESNIRVSSYLADGAAQGKSPRQESKMMSAETVAKKVFKATKKRKRDLIMTTQGKLAVFFNKWIPGVMDKIVYNHMAKEADSPFK